MRQKRIETESEGAIQETDCEREREGERERDMRQKRIERHRE